MNLLYGYNVPSQVFELEQKLEQEDAEEVYDLVDDALKETLREGRLLSGMKRKTIEDVVFQTEFLLRTHGLHNFPFILKNASMRLYPWSVMRHFRDAADMVAAIFEEYKADDEEEKEDEE